MRRRFRAALCRQIEPEIPERILFHVDDLALGIEMAEDLEQIDLAKVFLCVLHEQGD